MNASPGPQLVDLMLRTIFKYDCDVIIKCNVTVYFHKQFASTGSGSKNIE